MASILVSVSFDPLGKLATFSYFLFYAPYFTIPPVPHQMPRDPSERY